MEKEVLEPKEDSKVDLKEDIAEWEEPTYIAGDDWTIPIEFDRDISNADILFTLKKWDFTYEDEKIAGDHKSDRVTVFSIPSKVTSKLEKGEYKWMASVIENKKKVSTKPKCIYVETM